MFPKNVGMHEQIMNIKREFLKLQQRNSGEVEADDINYVPQPQGENLHILIHSMDAGSLKSEES
jgi:hypothetical protein